jgi:uncharacterized phage protein (TIGR01671 family)
MNRPIKFRVYNTKQNKWIHGPDNEVNLFGETILLGGFMQNVPTAELNDCVALQYTGLTDINGKEIYEGDIVNYKTWHGRYDVVSETFQSVVRFQNGAFYPRFIEDINEEDDWYSYTVYDLKVVGNEMEHKHLDKNE